MLYGGQTGAAGSSNLPSLEFRALQCYRPGSYGGGFVPRMRLKSIGWHVRLTAFEPVFTVYLIRGVASVLGADFRLAKLDPKSLGNVQDRRDGLVTWNDVTQFISGDTLYSATCRERHSFSRSWSRRNAFIVPSGQQLIVAVMANSPNSSSVVYHGNCEMDICP